MLFHNDPFNDLETVFGRLGPRGVSVSAMPMDAYRRGEDVWVHLDLPGVSTESIDISIERNVLTVRAERDWARQEDDEMYLAERRRGSYQRQVHLGDGLDAEHIEADYQDGVLTLRIPVAERAKPRKIDIGVGGTREAIDVESSAS